MHQLREHLFLGSFVGWQLCPQAGLTPGSPLPVTPRQLEATTLIRSCLLKVLVFCLRTKRVVTDHQWSQLCSRIMVALATSLAELTPANIEWMARSPSLIPLSTLQPPLFPQLVPLLTWYISLKPAGCKLKDQLIKRIKVLQLKANLLKCQCGWLGK